MGKPLIINQKELRDFHAGVGADVHKAFELGMNRHLTCQKYDALPGQTVDIYRLVDSSEYGTRARNMRRVDIDVFPILIDRTEVVLVGLSFEWVKSKQSHRFSSAQFIVFSGRKRIASRGLEIEGEARQILRLEWAGLSEAGVFEAVVAAHPHWQIDAMPEVSGPIRPPSVRTIDLAELNDQQDPKPKSWLSHVHLPSAAHGWAQGDGWPGCRTDCSAHANAPTSTKQLRTWVASAARYLNHQLPSAYARDIQ